MVWVFGIVFLTIVVFFALLLSRKSQSIRRKLGHFSRKRRVLIGVIGSLLSFGSAYVSLLVASKISNWEQPSPIHLFGIMFFMVGFVVLQVASMLSFVSIVTDSETTDGSKRS